MSPQATRAPRANTERARQAILEHAGELLVSHGFGAMTMDDVAARAHTSKTTLYKYWPTKSALAMDAFLSEIDPRTPYPDTGSVVEDFRVQLRTTADLFNVGRIRSMLAGVIVALPDDPDLQRTFVDAYMRPRRAQGELALQRGIERGELRDDMQPGPFFDQLYGALYLRLLAGLTTSTADVDAAVDQAFRGVLSAETASRARPR